MSITAELSAAALPAGISSRYGVAITGSPATRSTPPCTVRPSAGSAGVHTITHGVSASCRAASSAPTLPRRVESSFLNHTVRPAADNSRHTALTRAAASAAGRPRDCVLITGSTAVSAASAKPHVVARSPPPWLTSTSTAVCARSCTPPSIAPVRSSATTAAAPCHGQAPARCSRVAVRTLLTHAPRTVAQSRHPTQCPQDCAGGPLPPRSTSASGNTGTCAALRRRHQPCNRASR